LESCLVTERAAFPLNSNFQFLSHWRLSADQSQLLEELCLSNVAFAVPRDFVLSILNTGSSSDVQLSMQLSIYYNPIPAPALLIDNAIGRLLGGGANALDPVCNSACALVGRSRE
jgi:hypothetical protein